MAYETVVVFWVIWNKTVAIKHFVVSASLNNVKFY